MVSARGTRCARGPQAPSPGSRQQPRGGAPRHDATLCSTRSAECERRAGRPHTAGVCMGPPDPHAIPAWRPSTFPSDAELADHPPSNAFLETSPDVFGATRETLDFYGTGAGAPPAADETSDSLVIADPGNPYLDPHLELESGEDIDLTALNLTGIDPALYRNIDVGPTPSQRWEWSPHGWQAVDGEAESGGGLAASCTAMFLLAALSASGVGAPQYLQNDSRVLPSSFSSLPLPLPPRSLNPHVPSLSGCPGAGAGCQCGVHPGHHGPRQPLPGGELGG